MLLILSKIGKLLASRQTYMNLLYLGLNIGFGFAYYITFQVVLALAWGLTFPNAVLLASPTLDWATRLKLTGVTLGGILILPMAIWVMQLMVVPEQWLANLLLKEEIPLDLQMWSRGSILLNGKRFFLSAATWRRLFHSFLKIPLGIISFFVFFTMLIPAVSAFGMPLAYLVGFDHLIIGRWALDTVGKALLACLAGIVLVPLALCCTNIVARVSGWLARVLLPA